MNAMNNLDLQVTNLANAVPAEEQAVEQVQTELPPLTVVLPPRPAELALSEEEQAIDPGETNDESYVVRKYGVLATIDGMANIQSVFDNRLYASVSVDEEGNRSIIFCEKYSAGTFSPKMRVSQGDLHMLQMYNTTSLAPLAVKMKNHAAKFLLELSKDYLDKFMLPGVLRLVARLTRSGSSWGTRTSRLLIIPMSTFWRIPRRKRLTSWMVSTNC